MLSLVELLYQYCTAVQQYSSTAAGQNKAYEKWSKASSIIIAPLIELIIILKKKAVKNKISVCWKWGVGF